MSSADRPTRKRILDAAWSLLEAGERAVRMSDIARAAGVSRQALYLHFPSRADLLVATTRHVDEAKDIDARLAPSREAQSGTERLSRFIEAWGDYIPEIHGVARALMAMQDSDEEARQAWSDRMQAVRHGCEAAVAAIAAEGRLTDTMDRTTATDLLWTLLSVRNWEQLVRECGWTQDRYITEMQRLAARTLLTGSVKPG